MVKRNQFAAFAHPESTLAKRVKHVEAQVKKNRPEMKSNAYTKVSAAVGTGAVGVWELSALSQGEEASKRVGNVCRLYRLEVRGQVDPLLDCYIIQSKNATVPAVANFGLGPGGFVDDDNNNFVEWKHFRVRPDQATNCPFKVVQFFRNGYTLEFAGAAGSPLRNRLYFVVRNNSGASLNYAISYKLWYTDA